MAKSLRQEQKDERRKQKEVVERISVAVETGSSQKTLISTRAGRLPLMFVMFGLQPNSTSSASERGVYTQI